jgi:hypothetical protein
VNPVLDHVYLEHDAAHGYPPNFCRACSA